MTYEEGIINVCIVDSSSFKCNCEKLGEIDDNRTVSKITTKTGQIRFKLWKLEDCWNHGKMRDYVCYF